MRDLLLGTTIPSYFSWLGLFPRFLVWFGFLKASFFVLPEISLREKVEEDWRWRELEKMFTLTLKSESLKFRLEEKR